MRIGFNAATAAKEELPATTPPLVSSSGLQRAYFRPQHVFNGIVWTLSHRPLCLLRHGWVLATDDELQWLIYRLHGKEWKAVHFHVERGGILRTLREKVSDRYGTYEGITKAALDEIQSWKLKTLHIKLLERQLTIEGHFQQWLKQQKESKIR